MKSIVAPEVFRERVRQYAEQNPEASVPEILGRFLAEPTVEQLAFVEEALASEDGSDVSSSGGGTEVNA